jgi:vacuolar-type H+-ATPase subunit H
MIKDTISAVKEAEKQAAQTVSDAWAKSEELYRKSQQDAADIREKGRQDAHRVIADAHEAAVAKGRTDLADAEKQAEEEASELKKGAASGTEKAVDAVVAALLE